VLLLAFEASLNIERQLKFAVLPSFRLVLPESRRVGSFGIEKREESNYEANRKIQIGQTETFTFTLSFQTDLLTELACCSPSQEWKFSSDKSLVQSQLFITQEASC